MSRAINNQMRCNFIEWVCSVYFVFGYLSTIYSRKYNEKICIKCLYAFIYKRVIKDHGHFNYVKVKTDLLD